MRVHLGLDLRIELYLAITKKYMLLLVCMYVPVVCCVLHGAEGVAGDT